MNTFWDHAARVYDDELLPLRLGRTWVVLHRENNTPGLIIHLVTNGSGVIPILLGVVSK